jgi:hypothetical protein
MKLRESSQQADLAILDFLGVPHLSYGLTTTSVAIFEGPE